MNNNRKITQNTQNNSYKPNKRVEDFKKKTL